jgi:hypothetical protein
MASRAEEVLARKRRELALGQNAEEVDEKFVDTSNPEVVNQKERQAQRKKERKEKVLIDLLSTTQGREFVSDFLVECDVFGSPIVRHDPHGTYSNIGMQNAGKWWLDQIFKICPDKYPKMLKEAQERMEE